MRFSSSSKTLWLPSPFKTRHPRQYFAVSTTNWSALKTRSLRQKMNHQQKSLGKRKEGQRGVRSCRAHQSESGSEGLWPRAWNVQPRKTLHSSGHWELWNIILRLLAIFPWAGHNADTLTLKAQLPVVCWLPKALAWGSWAVPKLTLPGGTTTCWQSWHRD